MKKQDRSRSGADKKQPPLPGDHEAGPGAIRNRHRAGPPGRRDLRRSRPPGRRGFRRKKSTESGIYRKPHGEYRYHTPHSSRHTFSRLCESYGVNEADRRRMLGHSFGNDITNGVYGHRSVEELRAEIEKIKLPGEFRK